jgi:DNA-binding CsgD family transcriptional regulator
MKWETVVLHGSAFGLIVRRWTLLEHFENDGKRFTLAVENRSAPPGVELLSQREREVVRCALAGLSNKEIAYELGLSSSTVRVLFSRARRKVGARTRDDLLTLLAGSDASRAPRYPGSGAL